MLCNDEDLSWIIFRKSSLLQTKNKVFKIYGSSKANIKLLNNLHFFEDP